MTGVAAIENYEMRHKIGCQRGKRPRLCATCLKPASFVDVVIEMTVTLKRDGRAVVDGRPSGTYVCASCAAAAA